MSGNKKSKTNTKEEARKKAEAEAQAKRQKEDAAYKAKQIEQSATNMEEVKRTGVANLNDLYDLYFINNEPFNYESEVQPNIKNIDQQLKFPIPQYGVQDFINERALWQKGVYNITGDPAWFYFKIFFHFHDTKGLFAGIMDDVIPNTCALRYLYGIRNFYKHDKILDRMISLCRFAHTLSYINSVTPWFFIGINGINKLNAVQTEDFTKQKSIDIVCNGESIDMRINTLLDMYRYACYDEINFKEIIPENLRKFDMSIIIMNVPIKYFQTGMMTSGQNSKMSQIGSNGDTVLNKVISGANKLTSFLNGSDSTYYDYKGIMKKDNSLKDSLSFQMYTLKNCEIDLSTMEGYGNSSMNNSQFNKMGNTNIKINYDRCYKHTFNEWAQMMYGTDGIYYDGTIDKILAHTLPSAIKEDVKEYQNTDILNQHMNRVNAIKNSIYNNFFNKDTEAYKGLIDFSEMIIEDSLINTSDPYYLGNIGTNYDQNSYENMWEKTKDKVNNFFSKPFKF